jgi:hypothetical protein
MMIQLLTSHNLNSRLKRRTAGLDFLHQSEPGYLLPGHHGLGVPFFVLAVTISPETIHN